MAGLVSRRRVARVIPEVYTSPMMMRPAMTLSPVLALLALGCAADDSVETGSGAGSETGGSTTGAGESSSTVPADSSSGGGQTSGTTTAPADTSAGSSSTGESLCGNGDMDDGEECDDGNLDEGDACHADCTFSFTVAWEAVYDGPASGNDRANDVLVDEDGTAYVLGSERTVDQGSDVWLRQYMPDGTEGWTYTYNGSENLDDVGFSLSRNAEGNFLIAGATTTMATGQDGLVLVVPSDGSAETITITFDGPGSGPGENDDVDNADAVAVDGDGNIDVVGTIRVGPQDWDVYVAEYDPSGVELWTATYAGPGGGADGAQGLHVAEDGTIHVLAYEDLDAGSEGRMLTYDTDGIASPDAPQEFTNFFVRGWIYADDSRLVVGDTPGNAGNAATLAFDGTWTQQWMAQYSDSTGFWDVGAGVANSADGNVVMVGSSSHPPQSVDAFVAAYGPTGTALWADRFSDMDNDLDQAFAAAAIDGAGDVTVVGTTQRVGEQRNVFVRRYHPQ